MTKSAAQCELNHFFQIFNQTEIPKQQVTAAAFSKARHKFSATAFADLNQQILKYTYQQIKAKTWQGLRVLAVDGTKYRLPNESCIQRHFGGQNNQYERQTPMGLGSVLYDVFQKLIIDAQLLPYRSCERETVRLHLRKTEENDLILYDRGYPAFWLFASHQVAQRHWLHARKQ